MLRNCPKLAFVDVETTGGSPARDRMTEVAIVLVWWPADGIGPPHCQRYSSLINPQVAVPAEISYLTGIDNAMVRAAPLFETIAPTVAALLDDAVFVAHHARFDYGFIKSEMARCGRAFQAKTLCTVRLSRLLHPDRSPHTLDALIIRHRLPCDNRHRAMGDAEVLWQFLMRMVRDHGNETVSDAAARLLKRPNLPAHLGIESVDQIPARPGIYFFHGLNSHPLYIGKSRNIRQRIASHFCGDHSSERGLRLASETRRISWQQTPGEFSALLAEIHAIDTQMPAHNRALRRQQAPVAVRLSGTSPKLEFVKLTTASGRTRRDGAMPVCERAGSGDLYGPFASRAAARARLQQLATEQHWCQGQMGLTRVAAGRPCFARQLSRCTGACVGEISESALQRAMLPILEELRIAAWPSRRLLIVEQGYGLNAWHLFEHWCWLTSGCGDPQADDLGGDYPAGRFDRHVYALLRQHFVPLPDADNDHWHEAAGRRLHRSHQLSARWIDAPSVVASSAVHDVGTKRHETA